MKALSDVNLKELKWVRRSRKEDELVSGDDVVGALHWASSHSSLAIAESADGNWTFKRAGFIHPRITIREAGKDTDLYIARMGWGGEATIMFPGQGAFRWTPNIWHRKWTLIDSDGKELMRIELSGIVNVGGSLTVEPSAIQAPKFSLLALLGWHLIMLVLSEDAASTAATVAAVMH